MKQLILYLIPATFIFLICVGFLLNVVVHKFIFALFIIVMIVGCIGTAMLLIDFIYKPLIEKINNN